jgi:hypothetical protein
MVVCEAFVSERFCEDYNIISIPFTFFCHFVSLVGEGATSESVCSFSVGKVNVLFVCELSIKVTICS